MTDHGSDVYGQVVGPADVPYSLLERALAFQCPDCLVNVFIEHESYEPEPEGWEYPGWRLIIAHDATCPWLTALEKLR